MANDRIYLRCKKCGASKMLAKYYPTLARYGVDTSTFVTEHMETCIDGTPMDLGGDTVFELLTEEKLFNPPPTGDSDA